MEQRRPLQLGALVSVEAHFFGQQRGVRPRPFRVAHRPAVVTAQRGHHRHQMLGVVLGRVVAGLYRAQTLLQAGLQGDPEPRRGVVREHQGHGEQGRQGQQPSGTSFCDAKDDEGDSTRDDPPQQALGEAAGRWEQLRDDHARGEGEEGRG